MATATINVRTDATLKSQAQQVFESIGLDLSTAVNLFLKQTVKTNNLPFILGVSNVPDSSFMRLTENGYTPDFESELLTESKKYHTAVKNGTAKLYKNAADLFADLDAEDDDDD
ncbi:MAG: type II toxin-antitoxin system RelB/DinJ family antitoxin [Oscillospiraceae bacterium]|nr:type II toxin-antitoxin system RelB/DinJ family antitoxin [Oscillospiraceae bacterium]